jgi:pyrophosphatase PpaX
MGTSIKLQGIIFDLDGTLANTLPVCFTAFKAALHKFTGHQYTNQEIAAYFGASEEGVIKQMVQSQWQECFQAYLEEYEKAHITCEQPFPGILTALKLCQENNITLGVVTGKGKSGTDISLKYLNLLDYFDIVETGSIDGGIKPLSINKVLKKWNISPEKAAYIGDSPSDIIDAKEVGVMALGAAWAETASFEKLQEKSPLATFRTVESLLDWIRLNGKT